MTEPEPVAAEAAEASLGAAEPGVSDVTTISQPSAEDPAGPAVEQAEAVTPTTEPDADVPVAVDTEVAPLAADLSQATPDPAPAAAEAEDPSDESAPAPAQPVPYAVDDSVLAILREEAEREANARRNEARPIETQTELGVDAAIASTLAAASALDADGKPAARRDLFPDVEEINSTLRPTEYQVETAADAADPAPVLTQARRGFRSGFLTVMTIAIVGAAVYVAAPMLGSAIPSLASPLDGYVAFVDSFRLQLDGLMRSATASLNAD
ncbi:MAG: hypothetical protein MUE52_03795 [Tabrizicola sp.]|nr:hypothetical protein [Tabrizicola sp.]